MPGRSRVNPNLGMMLTIQVHLELIMRKLIVYQMNIVLMVKIIQMNQILRRLIKTHQLVNKLEKIFIVKELQDLLQAEMKKQLNAFKMLKILRKLNQLQGVLQALELYMLVLELYMVVMILILILLIILITLIILILVNLILILMQKRKHKLYQKIDNRQIQILIQIKLRLLLHYLKEHMIKVQKMVVQ